MKEDTQRDPKVPIFDPDTRERLTLLIDRSIAEHEDEFPCLPLFRAGMREARRIILGDETKSRSPHAESVQVIAAGATVRRMRTHTDQAGTHRVVTVDLPDGGTVELWVDLDVAPVLAAQLADGPVMAGPVEGDYRKFADGELTVLQEGGIDCARCGRDVEGSAVSVRRIGYGPDADVTVVACHPRCGTSPWDCGQLACVLEMPVEDASTVVEVDGTGLSLEQLAGLACVECGAELDDGDGDLVGRVAGFGEVRQCLVCDLTDPAGGAL